MTEHGVVIAGGGPTGLMLAGELALAGTDVSIPERRSRQELDCPRRGGLPAPDDPVPRTAHRFILHHGGSRRSA